MASAIVGALRVILGLDAAALELGLAKSSKDIDAFGKKVSSSFRGLAKDIAVFSLAAGSLVAFVKTNVKAGADLQDTADRLGISAEKFQELAYAAKLAGIEQAEFVKSMEQFNKRMGDFSNNVTQSQKALGQLGINFKDIKDLSPDEQLQRVADGFLQLGNQQTKAAVAQDLWGKSGQKMLNL